MERCKSEHKSLGFYSHTRRRQQENHRFPQRTYCNYSSSCVNLILKRKVIEDSSSSLSKSPPQDPDPMLTLVDKGKRLDVGDFHGDYNLINFFMLSLVWFD